MRSKLVLALVVTFSLYANAGGPKNVKTSGGRFQLIQLSEMVRDQFLLDTETGRIWQRACFKAGKDSECDLAAWSIDYVEGINVTSKQLQDLLKKAEAN